MTASGRPREALDKALQQVAWLAFKGEFDQPLTLLVRGIVVTGTPTTLSDYLRHAIGIEDPDMRASFLKTWETARLESADDSDLDVEDLGVLLLKKARVLAGTDLIPTSQSVEMRVLISRVDAWTIGGLS